MTCALSQTIGAKSNPTISEGQSDDGEAFEEKLSDVLELASGKAAKDRTKALDNLRKAFSKKYIPWYLEDRWVSRKSLMLCSLNLVYD